MRGQGLGFEGLKGSEGFRRLSVRRLGGLRRAQGLNSILEAQPSK